MRYIAVRNPDTERRLWVDALCINQSDEVESTRQVKMMGRIYSETWLCLAWLGEFNEDALQAATLVDVTCDGAEAPRSSKITIPKVCAKQAFGYLDKLSDRSPDGHFALDPSNVPPGWALTTNAELASLNMLLDLDWWNRIWTVQELILPPRIALLCGSEECSDDKISRLQLETDHGVLSGCCLNMVRLPGWGPTMNRLSILSKRTITRPIEFDWATTLFRSRHCSNPKDKIFALLGLTSPIFEQLADYTLTKVEIYTRFLKFRIISTGSLQPLLRLREVNRDEELPSWVPDWQATVELASARPTHDSGWNQSHFFSASNNKVTIPELSNGGELGLRGVQVDRIKFLCPETNRDRCQQPSRGLDHRLFIRAKPWCKRLQYLLKGRYV